MEDTTVITIDLNTKQQLAKLVIGTTAGFIATKLVEKAFESYVTRKNTTTTEL